MFLMEIASVYTTLSLTSLSDQASMFSKLNETLIKYDQLCERLVQPEIITDHKLYTSLLREQKGLEPLISAYREYISCSDEISADEMLLDEENDQELRQMIKEDLKRARENKAILEERLKILLIPRDPNDDRNVIVEIRAGAGGEEAALFASDLFRMYSMYSTANGFSCEVFSTNETGLGGYKQIAFTVKGDGAYSRFKFESGVHRVQRVPVTESQGRIQTSTVTVAVLPEAEEVDVSINPEDIIFESCKSSGAGGQHINKTESAVRLTHKPSGIVIECQQERSQLQNKEKALNMLRAKLYMIKKEEQESSIADTRRSQVGSGDRSEKIRTYNFPQSRVTDHRIGLTLYSLDSFMNGDISGMIDALITADSAEKLKNNENRNF